MTHTPGPWTIYDDGDSGDNSDIVMAWIDDDEGGCEWARNDDIAAMMMDRPASERKANARLIASAPELLEACEVANRFFEENDDFTDGMYPIPGFILDMRIAIAKATGTKHHPEGG